MMRTPIRCLLASGGSPHSEAALRFSLQIIRRTGEPPTILTVIRRDEERARAEGVLTHAQDLLIGDGAQAQTKIRRGDPAQQIVAEAREGNYDLIILGERQNHRLPARLLGSAARHVVEHAPCPVIIAKGKIKPIQRILLCDGGGTAPSLLARFTAQLAGLLGGEEEITVLHVMSQITAMPGVPGKQLRASAKELIEENTPEGEILLRDLRSLEQPGIRPHAKVRHGLVVEQILEEGRTGDYDLVVIGAHRHEGWQRFLLDDLAERILAQIDRPLLVVR